MGKGDAANAAVAASDLSLLFDVVWRFAQCGRCYGTGSVMVGYEADECPNCQGHGAPLLSRRQFDELGNALARARAAQQVQP